MRAHDATPVHSTQPDLTNLLKSLTVSHVLISPQILSTA